MSGRIDTVIYDAKFAESTATVNTLVNREETVLTNTEIEVLNSKKVVDLSNPIIFKENIKTLVNKVEVTALDLNKPTTRPVRLVDYTISFNAENPTRLSDFVKPIETGTTAVVTPDKRDIIFRVSIKMFDGTTQYVLHVNSRKNNIEKVITVEKK